MIFLIDNVGIVVQVDRVLARLEAFHRKDIPSEHLPWALRRTAWTKKENRADHVYLVKIVSLCEIMSDFGLEVKGGASNLSTFFIIIDISFMKIG